MSSRYTKKIPEYVYFVGSGEWIEGPYVKPKKGRENRKFKITEVIEEPTITLGVICLNKEDFKNWKSLQNFGEAREDKRNQFKRDNKIFFGFYTNDAICGTSLDELIETELAKTHKHYNEIKSAMISTIKQK